MSLFPAYASEFVQQQSSTNVSDRATTDTNNQDLSNVEDPVKGTWLDNASFSFQVSEIPLPNELSQSLEVESRTDLTPKSGLKCDRPTPTCEDGGVLERVTDNHHKPTSKPTPPISERKPCVKDDKKRRHESKSTKADKQKTKKHRHKSSRAYDLTVPLPEVDKDFYTDRKKERGNLKVSTLTRPIVPLYHVRRYYVLGIGQLRGQIDYGKRKSSKKKRSKDRYFTNCFNQDDMTAETNPESSMEDELSKQTALFNKTLGNEPRNVEVWLQYVKFQVYRWLEQIGGFDSLCNSFVLLVNCSAVQDTVCQFERTYRRGGGAQGNRVTAERKLAIIDKALTHNPDSEPLLLERGALAEVVFPADELSQQFATLLEQRPRSMALWRSYISATQFALSLCTVSKVTELYGKAMMRFHQSRRGAPSSQTRPAEEHILDLLLECGLFLRQAGLFEQLWTLLRHCLELNLTLPSPDQFKVTSGVSEERVIETEEAVLGSDLPLPELWVRVEGLRESVHWLPWEGGGDCEDPQRLVFPEDVSDLLHPVTTPELGFRLAATVATLLKVPALPGRHTASRSLGMTRVPWGLDAPETVLAAAFPFATVDSGVSDLLSHAVDLAVGPSYLSHIGRHPNPGQEHYLDFVTRVFHACGECMTEPARSAWYVWWLRFERFLLVLAKNKLCKLPAHRKKKLKAAIKDFLKHDHNRNNLLFYREYALVERELGNHDAACSVLRKAVSAQQGDRTQTCHLYRTLCEVILAGGDVSTRERHASALEVLSTLPHRVFQLPPDSAAEGFRRSTDALLDDLEAVKEGQADGDEHLRPDLLVDWVALHAWFLYVTKSTWEAGALMEDVLTKVSLPLALQDVHCSIVSKTSCQREGLFEAYISVLHQHCQETLGNFSVLHDVVRRALKEFPNNVHFLAAAARVENRESSPWWKLKRLFDDTDTQLSRIFLVLLAKQRQAQAAAVDTNALTAGCAEIMSNDSCKNRLTSLFSQLISHPSTRRCPLMWRLYLRFLFESSSLDVCRSAFYRAVGECPWVKALYVDGAKMLPADIQQVQDLIIEKELRLHVTPEELDILRTKT